jgi:predicted porin
MKKTLIALAAIAAVSAASAQVTLYGRIDAGVSVTTTNSGAAGESDLSVNKQHSGNQSGSRWGLKGTENLGGGMSASFVLENSLAIDTGASTGFSRQAFISVAGPFGALSLGRQYTAIDNLWGTFDPQGYTGASAMSYAWNSALVQPLNAAAAATYGAHWDMGRRDNMIQYALPAMGAFSAYVQVSPGEDNDTAGRSAGNYAAFGLNFASGPFAAGVAYENTSTTTAAVTAGTTTQLQLANGACVATGASATGWTNTNGVCTKALAAAVATNLDTANTSVMGSYDLGMLKLFAGFEQGKTPTKQDTGWNLGVVVPVGATSIQLGYAKETQIADGNAIDGLSKAFGGQVVYTLSKQTNLYGSYISGTANAPVATAATAQPESKMTNFAVGVRHSF